MYAILRFALRQRFVGYVSNAESIMRLALRILFFVILLVNAAMVGWLIDVFVVSDNMPVDVHEFIRIISVAFCGLWALLEFFPTYTQRSKLVSGVFPVSFAKRWVANLMYDTITATTVGTVIAFFLIDVLSKTYTHIHLAYSLVLFGNTIAFIQVAKAFVEATHRNRFQVMITWAVLTGIVVALVIYQLPASSLLTGQLGFCLLNQLALLAYVDWSAIETNISPIFTGNVFLINQLSPVYLAFLNNPKSRSVFGLGIFLKTGLLLGLGQPFMKSFPLNEFLEMSYMAPMILFTYVANNIWGFFPTLWVNSTLGKRSDAYRLYFKLISLPILLDLVVTLGVTLYLEKTNAKLLIFYILSTITLSGNGLIFSLYKAFYVHSSFSFGQMKNNVNGWSIFSAAVLIGLLMLSLKTEVTTLLFSVSLIAATWYILNRILPNDTDNRHILYKQLFTDRN